jgi:nucleoside-diphosphate-sugar epimerase
MNQSILVSGGTGLLGSHLLVQLAQSGKQVMAVYRNKDAITEVEQLFKYYRIEDQWNSVHWIEADINNIDSLIDHMNGVTEIYHCAALVSFNPADAEKLFEANVVGTRNMVNLALNFAVDKLIYVSSTAAIGRSGLNGVITEDTKWVASPENTFYAKSKHMAEQEVWRGIEEGLSAAIVNPCVIIGPVSLEKSTGVMFSQVLNGLKYYTKGANAFVDVRDVADIMVKLMESDISGQRYLTIGENLSFKEIFRLISSRMDLPAPNKYASKTLTGIAWRFEKMWSVIMQSQPRITVETARASHRVSRYSSQKIKKALNFEFRPVEAAVDNTVDYMKFRGNLT